MDPFLVSAGINAVGSLFKGIGGFFGANNQARAMQAAAAQAGSEAGVNAQTALQQGDAVAAKAATQAAANGGGITGSSLAVIQDLSQKAMFNARSAAYRGATEVQRDLYQAKVAKQQGLMDLIGSISPAVGDIAGGEAQSQFSQQQLTALKQLRGNAGGGDVFSPGPDPVLEDVP